MTLPPDDVAAIDELGKTYTKFREEIGKIIIGQEEVIEQLAIALIARGHALVWPKRFWSVRLRKRSTSASTASSSLPT